MRHTLLPAVVAAALLVACTGDQSPVPTGPPQLHTVTTAAACTDSLARTVSGEIGELFRGTVKSDASTLWRQVQRDCATTGGNRASTFAYYRYFLQHLADRQGTNVDARSAHHFNHVAAFAGFTTEAGGIMAASFTSQGAIAVCEPGGCTLETGTDLAGISVPGGALLLPHLLTIYPRADAVCQRDNLDFKPYCFQFSVTPYTLGNGTQFKFEKAVTVVVCQAPSLVSRIAARLKLAHPTPVGTDDAVAIEVAAEATSGYASTFHCGDSPPVIAWAPAGSGPLSRSLAALSRLADRGLALLAPQSLYAGHAGKGGTLVTLSPIGAIDPYVLEDEFTYYALGAFPADTTAGDPTAPRGRWYSTAKEPGSLTIVTSTAFSAPTFTPTPAPTGNNALRLAQAGGNCATCGGLVLAGTVHGTPPTRGVYEVSLEAYQERPSPKEAAFYVREGLATATTGAPSPVPAGDSLAKLAYRTLPSGRVLTFNGVDIDPTVATWAPGVRQKFTIVIDLDANRTSLKVNGIQVVGPTPVVGATVSAQAEPRMGQFTAEFKNWDAGVVYIDNVTIIRTPDCCTVP